ETAGQIENARRVRPLHERGKPGHGLVIKLQVQSSIFVRERLGFGSAHKNRLRRGAWKCESGEWVHSNTFPAEGQVSPPRRIGWPDRPVRAVGSRQRQEAAPCALSWS